MGTYIRLFLLAISIVWCLAFPKIPIPPDMPGLLPRMVAWAGTIAGMRRDPVAGLALVVLAFTYGRPLIAAVVAATAAAVMLIGSWEWQAELGIVPDRRIASAIYNAFAIFIAGSMLSAVVAGAIRLVARSSNNQQ